jgi:hypothetical protein
MPADLASIKSLTPEEVAAVEASMAATHKAKKGGNQLKVLAATLKNPVIYVISSIKFTRDVAFYGVVYWCGQGPRGAGGGAGVGRALQGTREGPGDGTCRACGGGEVGM